MDAPVKASAAIPGEAGGVPRFLSVFPSVALPMMLAMMDQTIVATAIPSIAADLGEIDRVSWLVVAYMLTSAISAPVYGRLGDFLGARRMLFVALTMLVCGSLLCAMSTTANMLIFSRALQGLAGGGMMSLSNAILAQVIPPRERARYQGYIAGVAIVGSTVAPVVGGFLTQAFGWPMVFLFNLPVGALAILMLTRLRLPPQANLVSRFRFDVLGLILFANFVVCLLLAVEYAKSVHSGTGGMSLALLAISLVTIPVFLWWERRTAIPLIPFQIFSDPTIRRADAMMALHGFVMVSSITFFPLYLGVARGLSAGEIGLVMLATMITTGVGTLLTGRMIAQTGRATIFPTIAMGLIGCILGSMAFFLDHLSVVGFAAMGSAFGVCLGAVGPTGQIIVQVAAKREYIGAAIASAQLSRTIGASTGTAIVGAVIFAVISYGAPDHPTLVGDMLAEGRNALAHSGGDLEALKGVISMGFRLGFATTAAAAFLGSFTAARIPTRNV
jgi:MFS family permease